MVLYLKLELGWVLFVHCSSSHTEECLYRNFKIERPFFATIRTIEQIKSTL
jgi:hypothetical protein